MVVMPAATMRVVIAAALAPTTMSAGARRDVARDAVRRRVVDFMMGDLGWRLVFCLHP